jgi:hypothetical protein
MGQKRRSSATFDQPSQNKSTEPMNLSANISLAGAQGKYFPPNSSAVGTYGAAGTVANESGWLVSVPGTLNNLRALLDTAAATNPAVFTVYKNNVATPLSASVATTATTGSDTTHQVTVVAGDYISVSLIAPASTAWTNGAIALQFVPT